MVVATQHTGRGSGERCGRHEDGRARWKQAKRRGKMNTAAGVVWRKEKGAERNAQEFERTEPVETKRSEKR